MDGLMKLYKGTRVNDYWKGYTHAQIDIAHRILEYLCPDGMFLPKDLNGHIMECFLRQNVVEAVDGIMQELGIDIDSSHGHGDLVMEAVDFAKEELEGFLARRKDGLLTEREKLLIQIGELEAELEAYKEQ